MKFLLLTTIGNNDQWYSNWFKGSRNFDVGLVCYEKTTDQIKTRSDFYHWHLPDFKYPALYQILENNPFIFEYDYIFMPDDDILMTTEEINTLFEWAYRESIWMGQPSITPKNYTWPITLNNPSTRYRWVKMIEVMCPIFSTQALQKVYPTFNESFSGWGLDAVWAKLINYNRIAICDTVIASHEKPLQEGSGRLYEKLKNEKGITDPRHEMNALLRKYNAVLDFVEYGRIARL